MTVGIVARRKKKAGGGASRDCRLPAEHFLLASFFSDDAVEIFA